MTLTGLSPRLAAVVDAIAPCERLADVGTDHGRVPLAAVGRGVAALAWAIDRRPGPLAVAAAAAAHEPRVTAVLGDGLAPVAAVRPDAVVVAGLGARTIAAVLAATPAVLAGVAQLVLQPNTEAERLRRWAAQAGWHVADEHAVADDGRAYVVLRLVPGRGPDPAYAAAGAAGFTASEGWLLGPRLFAGGGPAVAALYAAQAARLAGHGDPRAGVYVRALARLPGT